MKKALIIAHDFPPLPTIGALRPYAWYKYFPKNDIYPIVVTRKWSDNIKTTANYSKSDEGSITIDKTENGTIVYVPYQNSFRDRLVISNKMVFLRKFLTLFEKTTKWFCFWMDEKKYLYRATSKILEKEKVDFIIVSGEPFILFRYASILSSKYKIPWVPDYRDGWYVNHSKNGGFISRLLVRYELIFEKKYLKSALLFSSVSQKLVEKIQNQCYPQKGVVHANGVDLELIENTKGKVSGQFIITYAGSLYDQQNVSAFINGFLLFKNKFKDGNFKLRLIGIGLRPGKYVSKMETLQQQFPKNIEIIEAVPHEQVIEELMASSLLLKFNIALQSAGLIGGKVYEYIATGKPILTVLNTPENSSVDFPEKKYQSFVSTEIEVEQVISEHYQLFLKGEKSHNGITSEDAYRFSRASSVESLATEIKTALNN